MSFLVDPKTRLKVKQVETFITSFDVACYEEVLALWRQCDGIGLSEVDSRENIRRYLQRNPGMSFIAVDGGAVIGTVLVGHDGRRGYLHHLAVHPVHRRRGLGRRLAEHALAALQREGIRKCHLFVIGANAEGLAFWQSLGWTSRPEIVLVSKEIPLP